MFSRFHIKLKRAQFSSMSGSEMIESCKRHTLFSWSAQKSVQPIVMAKASGIYFWDDAGKRYTDLNSQLMCSNIGHQVNFWQFSI